MSSADLSGNLEIRINFTHLQKWPGCSCAMLHILGNLKLVNGVKTCPTHHRTKEEAEDAEEVEERLQVDVRNRNRQYIHPKLSRQLQLRVVGN